MMKKSLTQVIILSVVALIVGLGGSYFYQKNKVSDQTTAANNGSTEEIVATVAEDGNIKNGDVFGSNEVDSFKDSAQGYLKIGGSDGEGSHQLLRAGGKSQTVYLMSSVTDLDKFDGMEVKVWGETQAGHNVGWLMDVGRVEIINTKGTAPEE